MARISLSQMFNQGLRGILNVQSQTLKTQNQIATGKRVNTPSDDPVAAARIMRIEQEQNAIIQYKKNIDGAENNLMLEETQFDAITNLLFRVRELTIQSGSGALTQSERQSNAAELTQRLDELHSLANTRNTSGEYIFGGYQGEQAPFIANGDGTFTYRGDAGQRQVPISDSTRIPTGDSGFRVFQAIPQATVPAGTLDGGITARVAAQNTGVQTMAEMTVTDATVFEGTYGPGGVSAIEIFTDDGAGIYTVRVLDVNGDPVDLDGAGTYEFTYDSSTGPLEYGGLAFHFSADEALAAGDQITFQTAAEPTISAGFKTDLAAFQQTFEANAPLSISITGFTEPDVYAYKVFDRDGAELTGEGGTYRDGEQFTVGGAEFRIVDGSVGSSFELTVPTTQSMLDTVGKLASQLSTLGDSAEDKLRVQDLIAETLANIDSIESSIGNVRSQIGARLNTLDSTRDLHDGVKLVNDKVLSEIRDLDYAEAITRLTQENFVLQAAQQSFAQISKLSLFNFLR